MMASVHRWMEAWVPAGIDPDTRRRLFLTAWFAWSGVALLVGFAGLNALRNPTAGLALAVFIVPMASIPFILRYSSFPRLGSHIYVLLTVGALFASASAKGGLASSVTGWMPGLAFVVMLLIGPGLAGWAWVGVIAGVQMVLAASVGDDWNAAFGPVGVYAASRVVAVVFSFFLASLFETARKQAYQRLERRRAATRQLLDHADQGFLSMSRAGVLGTETSAVVQSWLGPRPADDTLVSWIAQVDPTAAEWTTLALESLAEDLLPEEVCLDQLPDAFDAGDRTLKLQVRPMEDGAYLVILTDVTDALARAAAEEVERETARLVEHLTDDRPGVLLFAKEAEGMLARLEQGVEDVVAMRYLHTLKGNAAIFEITTVSGFAHELESICLERGSGPHPDEIAELRKRMNRLMTRLAPFIGAEGHVDVSVVDLEAIEAALEEHVAYEEALRMVARLRYEPASSVLQRSARAAKGLAERLGKECDVDVEPHDTLLPPERWAPFFTALPHVVRNAVDHGLETPDEREALGKAPAGRLTLSIDEAGGDVVITVADDGRGIDWERIRGMAQKRGLPHSSHEDLVAALFSDGVTTKEVATDVSGRGVGTAAVLQCMQELGGSVTVHSTPGEGTTFVFRAPMMARLAA